MTETVSTAGDPAAPQPSTENAVGSPTDAVEPTDAPEAAEQTDQLEATEESGSASDDAADETPAEEAQGPFVAQL